MIKAMSDGVESLLSWNLSPVEYAWTTPADDGLYIMIQQQSKSWVHRTVVKPSHQ